MQAIELFEERCVNYQAKGPISDEITALNVYLNSHHIVYSKVDYMMPEKPPTSEMLALAISDVCRGDSEYLIGYEVDSFNVKMKSLLSNSSEPFSNLFFLRC